MSDSSTPIYAFGVGVSSTSGGGDILDCFFPSPIKSPDPESTALIRALFDDGPGTPSPETVGRFAEACDGPEKLALEALANTDQPLTSVILDRDEPLTSTPAAYLKLHLLSHRLAMPNSQDLTDIFAHLPNVAWTSDGPLAVDELTCCLDRCARRRPNPRSAGGGQVSAHDQLRGPERGPNCRCQPDPTGRVSRRRHHGDARGIHQLQRRRPGPNMVEGRISQGSCWVRTPTSAAARAPWVRCPAAAKSPSASASTVWSGANAGTGIPLGDRCTIEAGLYITAGTPVSLIDEQGER